MSSITHNSQEQLGLECYLQLKQSQRLIRHKLFKSRSNILQVFPDIYYCLRSINILIPLINLDLEQLEESDLAVLITTIAQDPHRSWVSFLWIVPEGYQEEFEMYLDFIHQGLEITPLRDDEMLILDLPSLQHSWLSLSDRIDGYWDFTNVTNQDLIQGNYREQYTEIFGDLPKLTWQGDRPLAVCLYEALLQTVEHLDQQAAQAFSQSEWAQAIELYQKTVNLNPINPNNWANLGSSYLKQGNYTDAKVSLEQAIVLNPSNHKYFNSLGLICENLEQHENAIVAYGNAIQIDQKEGISYCNLGDLLVKLLQYEDAEKIYQEGLTADPWYYGLYLNLGNLWVLMGRNTEAIGIYKKAEYFNLDDPDLYLNMSIAYKDDPILSQYYYAKSLKKQKKYEEALSIYEKIIQVNPLCPTPFTPDVHIDYLDCLKEIGYEERVLEEIKDIINIVINQRNICEVNLLFIRQLLGYLNGKGEHQQSQTLIRELRIFSVPAFNELFAQLNFPILYNSESEITTYRESFIASLERVNKIDIVNSDLLEEGYSLTKSLINFFNAYQNFNDLDIQTKISNFIHRILNQKFPELLNVTSKNVKVKRQISKIKVGYISNHFRTHSGTLGILGWIEKHNCDKFECFLYHLGGILDINTQRVAKKVNHYHHICVQDFIDLDQWLNVIIQTIQDDNLDILVFTDVGMDIKSVLLSRLRLAHIQCVLWGHPITTGSKTIDYFLTASLMEPDNADRHYSERLVHLPNISWSYPTVALPGEKKLRAEFQLPDDRILYFSCQSLFKYLPQHDYIYPAIAQTVPNAYFMFLKSFNVESIFWERLRKAFTSAGLDVNNFCKILPRQSHYNFLALQGLSDIYLDTLTWSGGNTTLQALAWPIPVVTCPNQFMRGRHSYGILQTLGVTETIAHSEQEYIEIASELGLNPQWRSSVIEKIKSRNHRLYNDLQCVQAVETFFEYAYEKHQNEMTTPRLQITSS